jgi:23S rRNA (uracil1939-C5)-methyltransferase
VSDLSIVKLVAGGDGLGFLDGKAVFVPDTLPGENVRIRVMQRHRDFDRAALLDVREPSPHRITPPCRLAGTCGGCNWLHIRYAEQLAQKVAIVQEALRRVGHIEPPPLAIDPSPELGSRSRAQIHRQGDTRGYMAARSNQLVKVETCPIVAPGIDAIFQGAAAVPQDRERFTVFSGGAAVAVEGIDDERDLTVSIRGRPIVFSVGCFFQSNLAALDSMIPWALGELSGTVAADLYCGVGLFGAFLSERFSRIICVEENATAVAYARRNVTGTGHEFYPMSVEQWISSGAGRAVPDAVIMDPPRVGLGAEVRQWLRRAKPGRLVYVSCNPVTLARDLGELLAGGFTLDAIRLFDFYPQTSHVEAVAKLSREAAG